MRRDDSGSGRVATSPTRVAHTMVLALATVVALVLALVVVGAFVPAIPAIGILGSLMSGAAGLLAVVLLVDAAVIGWFLRRRRTAWRVLTLGTTAMALGGCVVICAQLVALGDTYGASVSPFASAPTSSGPDHVARYGQDRGEPLSVGVWEPAEDAVPEAARVALVVHGGGWASGSMADDPSGLKREMADQGWLVLSVEYTFATPNRPTWDLAESQVGCAMVWARANAARYGGDPSRLALLGDSAGGNLAINVAYRARAGTLTPACEGGLPTVEGVAVAYPAVDPYALYDNRDPIMGPIGRTAISQYIGGSPAEYPHRYEAVASASHVEASSPPTLIVQGDNDHLVAASDVEGFVTTAEHAGVDVTLVRIPHGEHGLDASPMGSQLYTQITIAWLRGLTTAGDDTPPETRG